MSTAIEFIRRHATPSTALPLAIFVIGLAISAIHIYGAALRHPALAEVAWLLWLLFDLVVIFAAYVAVRRMREYATGWEIWWPSLVAAGFLAASLWVNTDYVRPTSITEILLTWAPVLGSFFAWKLWRALEDDTADLRVSAVEAFKEVELPGLLEAEARRVRRELEAERMDAAAIPPNGAVVVDELAQRRNQSAHPSSNGKPTTDDLLAEFEAMRGLSRDDEDYKTEAIKYIQGVLDIGYSSAYRRYTKAVEGAAQ